MKIAKMLWKKSPSDLNVLHSGSPSPLWVACTYSYTECIEFLLDNLSLEQIQQPGPDGTTPLMQLFAAAKVNEIREKKIRDILIVYMFHFGMKQILEMAVLFANYRVFEIFHSFGCTPKMADNLLELAILSDQVKMVTLILQEHESLQSFAAKVGRNHHLKSMRHCLGLSLADEKGVSQLTTMSRKFPKFNDCLESKIKPMDPKVEVINLEQHVVPHLKQAFCPLRCYHEDAAAR